MELSEKTEGLELTEKSVDCEVNPADIEVNSGVLKYQPIEFRVITDPDERDALVKCLEKELNSIEPETCSVEEVDDELAENV